MKIIIRTKNIQLNQALKDFINEKINSLEKFLKILQNKEKYFNRFFGKGKPKIEAWVEIERTTLHHKKGPVFRAECQLRFPGKSIRAEVVSEGLRTAINKVKSKLQREFKQYSERSLSLTKRKERVSKKIIRLDTGARFKRRKGGRVREEGV